MTGRIFLILILYIHLLVHLVVSQIFAERLLVDHQPASAVLGAVSTGILLSDTVTVSWKRISEEEKG